MRNNNYIDPRRLGQTIQWVIAQSSINNRLLTAYIQMIIDLLIDDQPIIKWLDSITNWPDEGTSPC